MEWTRAMDAVAQVRDLPDELNTKVCRVVRSFWDNLAEHVPFPSMEVILDKQWDFNNILSLKPDYDWRLQKGVYLYINSDKQIIYTGKANSRSQRPMQRCLKKLAENSDLG